MICLDLNIFEFVLDSKSLVASCADLSTGTVSAAPTEKKGNARHLFYGPLLRFPPSNELSISETKSRGKISAFLYSILHRISALAYYPVCELFKEHLTTVLMLSISMGWLKGKSTGNHIFSHEIWDVPVIFPLNQSIDQSISSTRPMPGSQPTNDAS